MALPCAVAIRSPHASLPLCSLVFGSLVLLTLAAPARAETVIPLDGDVPDDGTETSSVPLEGAR